MNDYLLRLEIDNDELGNRDIESLISLVSKFLWSGWGIKVAQWGEKEKMLPALMGEKEYITRPIDMEGLEEE